MKRDLSNKSGQLGLTLIEMIVSIALFSMIISIFVFSQGVTFKIFQGDYDLYPERVQWLDKFSDSIKSLKFYVVQEGEREFSFFFKGDKYRLEFISNNPFGRENIGICGLDYSDGYLKVIVANVYGQDGNYLAPAVSEKGDEVFVFPGIVDSFKLSYVRNGVSYNKMYGDIPDKIIMEISVNGKDLVLNSHVVSDDRKRALLYLAKYLENVRSL